MGTSSQMGWWSRQSEQLRDSLLGLSQADSLGKARFQQKDAPASGFGKGEVRGELSAKQVIIAQAIKTEMSSGKSLKEAVRAIMESKQFNHMTVRRVAEKLEATLSIIDRLA